MDELLKAENLAVGYPARAGFLEGLSGKERGVVRALDGIDLSIGVGEIVALVGESGCGKTTTGKALLRLVDERYVRGTVRFGGADVYGMARPALRGFRGSAQMIYQDPYQSLNPKDSVLEIVVEPLRVHGLAAGRDMRDRAILALEESGLKPGAGYVDRYPHELSGGQRQRVAIASALILEPRFIVADEPVSMLDLSVRAGIVRLLASLRDRRGLAFAFITHDLSLAWLMADRVAIMYLGKIVEEGPSDDVISRPAHPYSLALVDVMPRIEPRAGRKRRLLPGEPPNPSLIPAGCRFRPRCRHATGLCAEKEPVLEPFEGAAAGHRAACHYRGSIPV
ncbi:MAG: ABC transporter ATP-binding protein [Spirochaetes bacterium]|nr:ABC transporter ATP-binding protein [Spirochaetota bacterium]MBU1078911.1 ABC transporter ATP-binding protein [Spirochaetota bacterium]